LLLTATESQIRQIGNHESDQREHALNLLHRLIDRRPTDHPDVDPPDALTLQTTPEVDVDRYDGLRQFGEKRHAS
jgi:hypothetical protein